MNSLKSTFIKKSRPVPPLPLNLAISKSPIIRAKPVFKLNVPLAFLRLILPSSANDTCRKMSACSVLSFVSISKTLLNSIGLSIDSMFNVVLKFFIIVSSPNLWSMNANFPLFIFAFNSIYNRKGRASRAYFTSPTAFSTTSGARFSIVLSDGIASAGSYLDIPFLPLCKTISGLSITKLLILICFLNRGKSLMSQRILSTLRNVSPGRPSLSLIWIFFISKPLDQLIFISSMRTSRFRISSRVLMISFFTISDETMVGINDTIIARTPITPPMDIPTIFGHLRLDVFFDLSFFLSSGIIFLINM